MVDKKSQHVGNHGGVYTDNDGQTKQFTYIDHDRHTTRLTSGREYKERTVLPLTPEELLIQDIIYSGTNADSDFILLYDTELATTFQFERFRKGGVVEVLHHEDEGWYEALEDVYRRVLAKRIDELKNYQKKKYGIHRTAKGV